MGKKNQKSWKKSGGKKKCHQKVLKKLGSKKLKKNGGTKSGVKISWKIKNQKS